MSGEPADGSADDHVVALRLTRRRLLTTVGTVGAAGLMTAGGLTLVSSATGSQLPVALSANLARLPGVDDLRAIGEAVEAAQLVDGDVEALTMSVAPEGEPNPLRWCSTAEPGALRRHVTVASSDDFLRGEVLEVDGWRLSRTEATLTVLVARS